MRKLLIEKYRSPIYSYGDGTDVYIKRNSGREVHEKVFNPTYINMSTSMDIINGQRIYIETPTVGQIIIDNGHVYMFESSDQNWVEI